ncbi:unnamed protein product [Caenorhabditis sp. 36 PRJEB53466]|nr:unnamed protein product [Caenorhabditis sp. 36 PRJEB53466]
MWNDTLEDPCAVSFIDQPVVKYPLMALYIIVFVVCLFGNLLTLLVMTTHPSMRTATNFFLCNLAVADLLVAVFCILQNMIHIVGFDHGNWPLGFVMCKLYLGFTNVMPCTSAGILVLVSMEKYIAVLHPLSGLKWLTQEHRIAASGTVWILSVAINFPYFLYAQKFEYGGVSACFRGSMPLWNSFSFFVWYLVPLTALVFIYSRISHLLWTSDSNRQSSRQSNESNGSQGNGTVAGASWQMKNGRVVVYKQESLLNVPIREKKAKEPKRPKDSEGRRKVVRLLVAVVVSFAVLTFPHHARLLITSFQTGTICNSHWTMLAQPLSYIFLFISSAINPILYACLSKRFRNAMWDVLYCRKGVFTIISRSRNRTLVSDVPPEDSRCPSPAAIRMNRIR